ALRARRRGGVRFSVTRWRRITGGIYHAPRPSRFGPSWMIPSRDDRDLALSEHAAGCRDRASRRAAHPRLRRGRAERREPRVGASVWLTGSPPAGDALARLSALRTAEGESARFGSQRTATMAPNPRPEPRVQQLPARNGRRNQRW